jgi:hypothetical protein
MKDYLGIALAALVIVLGFYTMLTLQRGLPDRVHELTQERFVQSQGNNTVTWKK